MTQSTLMFAALLVASATILTSQAASETSPAPTGQTLTCQNYSDGNTTAATCNEVPGRVCSGGCTGGAVVQGCALNEGDPTSPQTCTIAFGQSSAAISVCINEQGSFTCTGPSSGEATCSGCIDNNSSTGASTQNITITPNTASSTNTSSPDSPDTEQIDTSGANSIKGTILTGGLVAFIYIISLLH